MEALGERIRARVSIEVEAGGRTVADETLLRLLLLVKRCGSILAASRALGMAYSRAWERISRAERLLGGRLVEARRGGRGGGGARLTELGEELAALYLRVYRRLHGSEPPLPGCPGAPPSRGALLYAGSHDPALARLLGLVRRRGVEVGASWVGSMRGFAALVLGEADVAGVHVVDPETGEYNRFLVERMGVEGLALVPGYERLQGFASARPMGLDEILDGLLSGRLRLANRCRGAGTRLLAERLLRRAAEEKGLDPSEALARVRGWGTEARTHYEAAEMVARGEADVCLVVESAARLYGLSFAPVAWERFDFIVQEERLGSEGLRAFLEALCSPELAEILSGLPGYRPARDRRCPVSG